MTMQPMPMTRLRKRDRDGGPDDLLDDRRVDRDPRGDLRRPILLEEAGRQPQQVAVHRKPDVGDGPLAEPGDEIDSGPRSRPPGRRRAASRYSNQRRDVAGVARARREAFVDDQLESLRERRSSRPRQPAAPARHRRYVRDNEARSPTPCAGCGPIGPWGGCGVDGHGDSLTACPPSPQMAVGRGYFAASSKRLPRTGEGIVNDELTN